MLKHTQNQTLQQKLSPQAIQAQLLLAIPTIALEQEIKKQLEDNPVLEEESDKDNEPELNPDDYEYSSDNGYSQSNYSKENSEARTEYLINKQSKQKESPIEQLYSLGLDNRQTIIGEEILGSLDDDGYLRRDIKDLSNGISERYGFNAEPDEIESVLGIVQKLDPVGIASRDLKECLSVQLNEMAIGEKDKALSLKMINEYFDEFKHKHFEKLSKLLNVSLEKVNELFEIIHKLNPSPGKIDSAADYIFPDFIVTKIDGRLVTELTSGGGPKVRLSRKYIDLLNSKNTAKDTKEFLRNKIDSARWFINAIHSRRTTMLEVMKAIVKRQKDFFESNGENLKPMFEKDIADDIKMDVSTVSRVVRGKYVQTDFGIFELKYFFSGAMHTINGEDVSNKTVKQRIKDLIESENKSKPLSDDKLCELMNKSGFRVARRTVAKYREAMKIPKATLRRKILL